DAEMTGNRLMRIAALALAIVILPLAVFAAVSMGLRLNQYGLAPERLWGLVAILVACAWGIGYWIALARGGRRGWTGKLRAANFRLALGGCVLALLLALPILDFGAISTRNQVARLESGKVTPERFDFTALRWDFGDAGRKALARLGKSGDAKIAELAQAASRQSERAYATFDQANKTRADFKLRVQPDDAELRALVLDDLVANPHECGERCVALTVGAADGGGVLVAIVQGSGYRLRVLQAGKPGADAPEAAGPPTSLKDDSVVQIGEARFISIDGKPVGPPLD